MGQMCSTSDVETNLQLCRKLCVEAKAQGACFLSLPECFEFMGTPGTGDSLAMAQPLDSGPVAASSHDRAGSLFSRYQKLAKEHKLWLSLGGFHERTPADDPKMYNTHAIVSDQGALVAAYRKLHLFDVDYDAGSRRANPRTRRRRSSSRAPRWEMSGSLYATTSAFPSSLQLCRRPGRTLFWSVCIYADDALRTGMRSSARAPSRPVLHWAPQSGGPKPQTFEPRARFACRTMGYGVGGLWRRR